MKKLLVLDFGSQYTQLIARRLREMGVFTIILPFHSWETAMDPDIGAIILSGGPSSVLEKDAPMIPADFFDIQKPMLGICYGMQLMAKLMGGRVTPSTSREYGKTTVAITENKGLFAKEVPDALKVWMSHGDIVEQVPDEFIVTARSHNGLNAAIQHKTRPVFALQFHPEVSHTQAGSQILKNFAFNIANMRADWSMDVFLEQQHQELVRQVNPGDRVLIAVSGGVDSSVAAALLGRLLPGQVTGVFVDNGLLRKDEAGQVRAAFEGFRGMDLNIIDASEQFLDELTGVTDPEKKRKIIGRVFFDVFKEFARNHGPFRFLAQGTLYPDVIESQSVRGPSHTIKSHHNVGGLPKDLGFELLEPLRELFKDEVRHLGRRLGLPDTMVDRQPFPGPGLAVRVLGELTADKLRVAREADAIFNEELAKQPFYDRIWQSFAVLVPVRTVGVMGDARTYEWVVALRAVESLDAMTAEVFDIPTALLADIARKIIGEVRGANRVVYDVSSKPPGTIEWE